MTPLWLFIVMSVWVIATCDAFDPVFRFRHSTRARRLADIKSEAEADSASDKGRTTKTNFLDALDRPYDLNAHSETRTNLLNALIHSEYGIANPGSKESFASVAPGVWRVVYAPHMTIIASLFRGGLSVQVSGKFAREISKYYIIASEASLR